MESHFSICASLVNLIHNAIPYQPNVISLVCESDHLLKVIKILKDLSDKAVTVSL